MELAVVSSFDHFQQEIPHVISLFEQGMDRFHLRKPRYSTKKLSEYIEAIPEKYRKYIVVHSHHKLAIKYGLKGIHLTHRHRKRRFNRLRVGRLKIRNSKLHVSASLHSILSMQENTDHYDYTFISPVFNSISKKGYGSAFTESSLRRTLKQCRQKVYALGGINPETLVRAREMGFDGVAAMGYIWSGDFDPVVAYDHIIRALNDHSSGINEISVTPVKIDL